MKSKILILDRKKEDVDFFSDLLTPIGYEVIAVEDDYELFDLIEQEYPYVTLILINAIIDHEDSYLICKEIELLEKGANIPIIFINRNRRYFEPETMFKSGGVDYLNYPYSKIEVLTRIENQIKIKQLERQVKHLSIKLQKIIPHCQKLHQSLEESKANLQKLSHYDDITKLANYDHFYNILQQEWSRASRQRISYGDVAGIDISLILAQINDFDEYKKYYEKELTENCLKLVADCLKEKIKRPADLIAFYGEQKFAILLPNTNEEGAEKVADMVNENMKDLHIPHNYSKISDYVCLSMGVSTGIPTQAIPANVLIEIAEKSLEEALQKGEADIIMVDSF